MSDLSVSGIAFDWDNQGGLHFWGQVGNGGNETQRWVKVSIRLLDSAGRELAASSDILGLEWLPAQDQVPFHVVFHDAPKNWSEHVIDLSGQVHDFDDPNVPQPAQGVVVENVHYREIGRGGLVCSLVGVLRNKGNQPASHVKVAGMLFGIDGEVVSVLSPYIVPAGPLPVGGAETFELKYYLVGGNVVNYRVQAQGRIASDE